VSEFFAMGGYAWYVWGSYGVTFVLLAVEVCLVWRRSRETKA
jgi:heme exporter protein D